MQSFAGDRAPAPWYGGAGGIGAGPRSMGFTAVGPVGNPMQFNGIPMSATGQDDSSRLRNLFGETQGSVLGNFFQRGPVTQSTIEENMYGQVLVSTTAILTYRAVVGQGNWAILKLPTYHITYVHTVMQRYYYYRMFPARRTGHLDGQRSGSESMFSFQRTGHRVGTTAHARAEELYGPLEYAIRKKNWMIDQIVYGHMATHQHDLIAAVYMETLIREFVLSGGTRWTNEKFIEWELLETANVWGCLNEMPDYAAPKLAEYASRVDGTAKVGILPRRAKRMHSSLSPSKVGQAITKVIIEPLVQFSLGVGGTIDRSVPFPTDATLDPDSQPRAFGNLQGVEIYLEPSTDLTTGNSDTDTLLVNYQPVPEFARHGLVSSNNRNVNPNIYRIYDLHVDARSTVDASNRAAIVATGVFKDTMGSFGNQFPGFSTIYSGFSKEFEKYVENLKGTPATMAEYARKGAGYGASSSFYTEELAKMDLHHVLATYWEDDYPNPPVGARSKGRWTPASVIGSLTPHSLRHSETLLAAQGIEGLLAEKFPNMGMSFADVYSKIEEIGTFFNNLKFSNAFGNALIAQNSFVHTSDPDVFDLQTNIQGGYNIPDYDAAFGDSFLAGWGCGPLLRTLVESNVDFGDRTRHETHAAELRRVYPIAKAMLDCISEVLDGCATLATNILPSWYTRSKCTPFDAFCATVLGANATFLGVDGTGPVKKTNGGWTADVTFEDWVTRHLFLGGAFLVKLADVENAGGPITRFVAGHGPAVAEAVNVIGKEMPTLDDAKKRAVAIAYAAMTTATHETGLMATHEEAIKILKTILADPKFNDGKTHGPKTVAAFLRSSHVKIAAIESHPAAVLPKSDTLGRTMLNFTYSKYVSTQNFDGTWFYAADPEKEYKSWIPHGKKHEEYRKYFVDSSSVAKSYVPTALALLRDRTQNTKADATAVTGSAARSAYMGKGPKFETDYTRPGTDNPAAATNTALQGTGNLIESSHYALLLWRLKEYTRNSNGLGGKAGFFLWLSYILTPVSLSSIHRIGASGYIPLPFDMIIMRWCQIFQNLDMLFARVGCVQVLQTPLMTFLESNGAGQQIALKSKVMSNEFVERPSDAIRVPSVYVVDHYSGRGTGFVTPADSASWRAINFRRKSETRSIVVAMERHAQDLKGLIHLHNTPSNSVMDAVNKGALSVGYWTSAAFTVNYSHQNYFKIAYDSYNANLNTLPQNAEGIQKFIKVSEGTRAYNHAAGVDYKATKKYTVPLAFRMYYGISDIPRKLNAGGVVAPPIPASNFKVWMPSINSNPLSHEKWHAPRLDERLTRDSPLTETVTTRTIDTVY